MTDLLPEGLNGVVHGRGAIVPLQPIANDVIDYGTPREGWLSLGPVGDSAAGIWEMRDGSVFHTETSRVFVVISGGATIKLLDEGRSIDVKTGDVMRLNAGTKTRWIVKDHVRSVFMSAEVAQPVAD